MGHPPIVVNERVGHPPCYPRCPRARHRGHPSFGGTYSAPRLQGHPPISILSVDLYNKSQKYPIKKLQGVPAGEGQYRLRSGRFRFRYDIAEREVVLLYCGLRREDTY